MTRVALVLVVMAALLSSTSSPPHSQPSPMPCPELSVRADGKKLDLPLGLGARVPQTRGGGYVVSRFNHSEMDCVTYLKAARAVIPNELEIAAYVGPVTTNVRVNFSNALGAPAYTLALPQKTGDTISICVPDTVEHDPELSEGHRVKVAIQGLLTGTFCGDAE